MFLTIKRKIGRRLRRLRDYLKPRSDLEQVWHVRAGHLGLKALRALVHSARNVKINGTKRVKYEHCAITHA